MSSHQAEFSLSLENIMYYKPGLTWRTSWLESIGAADEDNFADLYRVAGLRGIYIASQVRVMQILTQHLSMTMTGGPRGG